MARVGHSLERFRLKVEDFCDVLDVKLEDLVPDFKSLESSRLASAEASNTGSPVRRSGRTVKKRASVPDKSPDPLVKATQDRSSSPEAILSPEDSSPLSSRKKRKRISKSYADPSVYAHLPQQVPSHLSKNLTLLICGLNPGVMTASTGHHFAHPSNLFWPLLYSSGIIDRPLKAKDSTLLVPQFNIGITNIVSRPTSEGGELSRTERVAGSRIVVETVKELKPRAVLFTGKGIWESVFEAIHGRTMKKADGFEFGWQEGLIGESRIFVTMGTSGRVAGYTMEFKREVFGRLGIWMKAQRANPGPCVVDVTSLIIKTELKD